MTDGPDASLLGAAEIRALAARHGIRPTKQWGQNFVVDGNTVRRIVRVAGVGAGRHRRRGRPGPGVADPGPAPGRRPGRRRRGRPGARRRPARDRRAARPGARRPARGRARRRARRAPTCPGPPPTALVANLPYNVSVPVVLRFLELFPTLRTILVMVQLEVAERLAAPPGSRTYGVPSVKAAWYADVRLAGSVSRSVFWPVPNVDSGLVALTRREPPGHDRHPRRGLRLRRRGVRPAPQDPARRARHLGGLAGPGRGRPAWRPASTRAPVASSSTSRRSRRSRPPARRRFRAQRRGSPAVWLGWAHDRRPSRARPRDRARPGEGQPRAARRSAAARTATTRLSTVFHAVSLYDDVTVSVADEWGVSVARPPGRRRAHRTATTSRCARPASSRAASTSSPCTSRIRKGIPVSGGMAGGSADAAATLVALDHLWDLDLDREEHRGAGRRAGQRRAVPRRRAARRWAAAVASCSRPVLARGTYHWVFALAEGGLSTPAVYAECDRLRGSDDVPEPVANPGPHERPAQRRPARARPAARQRPPGRRASRCAPTSARCSSAGMEYGALGGIVSGSGPTTAPSSSRTTRPASTSPWRSPRAAWSATSAGPTGRSTAPTSSTTGSTSGQPRLRRARLPRARHRPGARRRVARRRRRRPHRRRRPQRRRQDHPAARARGRRATVDSGRVARVGGLTVGDAHPGRRAGPRSPRCTTTVLGDLPEHVWASDPRIRDVLTGLLGGIDAPAVGGMSAPVGPLSGGERRRVALAALLVASPDLLLLDEPTNHLDVEGVAWLADHLVTRHARPDNAVVAITHDRWFLDAIATQTWEVDSGAVHSYEGGYAAFVLAKAERERMAGVTAERRDNLLRKELAWLRRGPPARTTKPKFRIDAANALIADEPPARDDVELMRFATTRLGKDVVDLVDARIDARRPGAARPRHLAPGTRGAHRRRRGQRRRQVDTAAGASPARCRSRPASARSGSPCAWPCSRRRSASWRPGPTAGSSRRSRTCARWCGWAGRSSRRPSSPSGSASPARASRPASVTSPVASGGGCS